MDETSVVRTDRLLLRPMVVADADALFPIFTDPDIWWFDPDGRHREPARTRRYTEVCGDTWEADGLSYWTVRLAETDEVIGSGGVQRHLADHWNLNYRIAREHQGRGYAGELVEAALAAARVVDPAAAVIAWIDEVNTPSIRVAQRAGLVSRGLRGGTFDGRARLAFADRELDDEVFAPVDR